MIWWPPVGLVERGLPPVACEHRKESMRRTELLVQPLARCRIRLEPEDPRAARIDQPLTGRLLEQRRAHVQDVHTEVLREVGQHTPHGTSPPRPVVLVCPQRELPGRRDRILGSGTRPHNHGGNRRRGAVPVEAAMAWAQRRIQDAGVGQCPTYGGGAKRIWQCGCGGEGKGFRGSSNSSTRRCQ